MEKKLKKMLEDLEKKRAEVECSLIKLDFNKYPNKWFALKGESIGLSEAISVILEAQIEEVE